MYAGANLRIEIFAVPNEHLLLSYLPIYDLLLR